MGHGFKSPHWHVVFNIFILKLQNVPSIISIIDMLKCFTIGLGVRVLDCGSMGCRFKSHWHVVFDISIYIEIIECLCKILQVGGNWTYDP